MASSSGQLLIPEDLLFGSSGDEDDESFLLLSQPFYPSPEPSLDFLQPISSDPSPPNFSSSSSSQELLPLPINPNVVQDLTSSVPVAIERSLSFQSLDEKNSIDQVLRRACSTGDLQWVNVSGNEKSLTMVERYNMEERRKRIDKYRIKRNQRNFNNTIKYACRKTLADSRPRVRGRFARSDVIGHHHHLFLPNITSTSSEHCDHNSHVNHGDQEEDDHNSHANHGDQEEDDHNSHVNHGDQEKDSLLQHM